MGLIAKECGLYRNGPETELALCSESPGYVGQLFATMNQMAKIDDRDILRLIQEGPPPMDFDMGAEDIWAGYARAMGNYQRSGIAQNMVGIVSNLDGFSTFKKMLDLGGRAGSVLHCHGGRASKHARGHL